jgi:membrane protein required for colicin V production
MVVDGIVAIILLISAVIAFLRGFIREILTILGIVGGIMAAYFGGPFFSPYVKGWLGVVEGEEPQKLFDVVPYDLLGDVLAYASLLMIFVVIFSVISHFISEFAKTVGLGAIDRTLGVVFGLVRGILLLGLLYLPFYYLANDEQKSDWFADSKSHFYVETTSSWIAGFIPQDVEESAQEGMEKVEEASETRKKLEELDLLGTAGEKQKASPQDKKDGYSEEFREGMDQLFEKSTDENKLYNE